MADEDVLRVAIEALRSDAGIWRDQSTAMGGIVTKLGDVHFGVFERTSLWQYMSAYHDAWTFARDRATEAGQQFSAIGRTLDAIALKYEQDEAARQRALRQYEEELRRQRQGR
jgi:hypothetical protein